MRRATFVSSHSRKGENALGPPAFSSSHTRACCCFHKTKVRKETHPVSRPCLSFFSSQHLVRCLLNLRLRHDSAVRPKNVIPQPKHLRVILGVSEAREAMVLVVKPVLAAPRHPLERDEVDPPGIHPRVV